MTELAHVQGEVSRPRARQEDGRSGVHGFADPGRETCRRNGVAAQPVDVGSDRVARASVHAGLYPYQQDGVDWLSRQQHALLADEPGLGKTPQAIRAADALGTLSILVICPAVAKINWYREFLAWQQIDRSVTIVDGKTQDFSADVLIINFDLLTKPVFARLLAARRAFSILICDEAHYLKNRNAKRTRAVYGAKCDGHDGLADWADRVWLLTGTPMPNTVDELWPMLRALWPDRIASRNYWSFFNHFAKTRETDWGPKVIGVKNGAELREILSPIMLRRKKAAVLKDLPAMRFSIVPIAGEAPAELETLERDLDQERVEALLTELDTDGRIGPAMVDNDLLSRVLRLTGMVKVAAAVQLLSDELDSGALKKVVVFARHRDVIGGLIKGLARFGVANVFGGLSAGQRQHAVDRFQTDPECRVFIGQVTAAGTAITLTAASQAVFVELDWVPATNAQAANRIHRIGQKDAVFVRALSLAGSADELVVRALVAKTRTINDVLETPTC